MQVDLNLLPKPSKDKYNNLMKNYTEKLLKLKKNFTELQYSREKSERTEVITY
jgi:hypothetical protein